MFGTLATKKRPKVILVITIALILTLGLVLTGCGTTTEGVEVGQRAPDFQLQDLDGQTVSLSGQLGLPVLVNFWGAWCGYCVYEMPYLQAVYEEWYGQGLTLLAVNVGDSSATAAGFIEDNGFSFTVLLDTRRTVSQQYHITGYPTTLFIDKDGIIRDKVIGAFSSQAQIESRLSQIIP